ncbi:unnamed protein product [Parajaminaea phylloscopi]
MARDVIEVTQQMGWKRSDGGLLIIGHDRGARVAHRLALDFPEDVAKLMILDIAPTVDMYDTASSTFASAYWHWFFLIQPYPFPEEMILSNPALYLSKMTTRAPRAGSDADAIHPPGVLAAYEAALATRSHVEATCCDYRESAPSGLDYAHDQESRSRGQRIEAPVRVLWGNRGIIELVYGRDRQLGFWQSCCRDLDVEGSRAVDSGHYIPEELPDVVVEDALSFFSAAR